MVLCHPIESSILWGNFGGNIETLKSVEYVLMSIPACYSIPPPFEKIERLLCTKSGYLERDTYRHNCLL